MFGSLITHNETRNGAKWKVQQSVGWGVGVSLKLETENGNWEWKASTSIICDRASRSRL